MARPRKRRRICSMPKGREFIPCSACASDTTAVQMTIDEFETIRLMDTLGYTQAECAQQMGVSRTSVQATYDTARGKLADMLVGNKPLKVEGGDVEVCEMAQNCCANGCCNSADAAPECPTAGVQGCPYCRKKNGTCPQ